MKVDPGIKNQGIGFNMSKSWLIGILIFLINFGISNIFAQTFQRIDSLAGLSSANKNNGVAIADYDADGDLDVFIVARDQDKEGEESSHSRLFKNNNNGTFSDVTDPSGLNNLFPESEMTEQSIAFTGYKFGAFWGDYNNDGFPDLFMTHSNKIQLFHNNGNGSFKEITEEAGFKKYNDCINTDALWFDYNNDGLLDIYISAWDVECEGNRLYKNNGDSTFSNVSAIFQGVENKHSYQSIPFDFNNDGWLDLYVANDFVPGANDLFINNSGRGFIEKASYYGLANSGNDMGVAVGDYNNDGSFDIYISTVGENALFSRNSENTYTDLGKDLKIYNTFWAWDVNFSDFDLDGDEDLFVVNGFDYPNVGSGTNVYFENLYADGENQFINSSQKTKLGLVETISIGAGVFDFDNDGDLDILVTNNDGPSHFYENTVTDFTNPNNSLHWLKIKLEGTISNRDAIGTKISIKTANGSLHRLYTAKGFISQNLTPVHFGLGLETEIRELKITWPSGLIEVYKEISVNSTIAAREGSGYTIVNDEPSKKVFGCTDLGSCNYNPYAVENTGSCNYLQTGEIMGNLNPQKNSTEVYAYTVAEGSLLNWHITGGKIIEESNSGEIKIQWGSGESGKVSLTVSNASCTSEVVELLVDFVNYEVEEKDHSIARYWNEVLLDLIRQDYARPVVHARNLFHTSVAIYDAWALYNNEVSTYLIGKKVHGFQSTFSDFKPSENVEAARRKTISYAVYRLLSQRFDNSPNPLIAKEILENAMNDLEYDPSLRSEDYSGGDPIALGNFIARQIIDYGLKDGSNEVNNFGNLYYTPVNDPLDLAHPQNILNIDPNRWQPLTFESFIDQSGNLLEGATPEFIGPEWGNVLPFSLEEADQTIHSKAGKNYIVYDDPGKPPAINDQNYRWAFSLVSKWASHLDPGDGVLWDISPGSIGNLDFEELPEDFSEHQNFYKEFEGGDIGRGRTLNPYTQSPYEKQIVPRGDYTRVLAEFWADGPDSETPPGHWFTILNYVNDHELLEKKFNGKGPVLNDLEWDVKSYFIMGGAMHDAAIAAWSIKGWYDFIRPISAIRYMCAKGQSSNPTESNYNPEGVPLKEGFIEVIKTGDPLSGENNRNLGKIKLYSWKGHSSINNPSVEEAGVGWILAENWWPYQRPTFVTPPFAGYISGHSTFSRAAAEVMTSITGDKYFPGGMGEFVANKNEFLIFEEGPSVDITLQWATYRDASDQCSLSRIWGGIHPPIDDIPGRIIGERIGKDAFEYAISYFTKEEKLEGLILKQIVFPNPVRLSSNELYVSNTRAEDNFKLFDMKGSFLGNILKEYDEVKKITKLTLNESVSVGIYILIVNQKSYKIIVAN